MCLALFIELCAVQPAMRSFERQTKNGTSLSPINPRLGLPGDKQVPGWLGWHAPADAMVLSGASRCRVYGMIAAVSKCVSAH